jgi:hypothetical protein
MFAHYSEPGANYEHQEHTLFNIPCLIDNQEQKGSPSILVDVLSTLALSMTTGRLRGRLRLIVRTGGGGGAGWGHSPAYDKK